MAFGKNKINWWVWPWQNGKRQLKRLLGIATIVSCEPGMGAAEDNSRLSTHEGKLG